jgi:hypothetical protein
VEEVTRVWTDTATRIGYVVDCDLSHLSLSGQNFGDDVTSGCGIIFGHLTRNIVDG